jgi:hypothetical protein
LQGKGGKVGKLVTLPSRGISSSLKKGYFPLPTVICNRLTADFTLDGATSQTWTWQQRFASAIYAMLPGLTWNILGADKDIPKISAASNWVQDMDDVKLTHELIAPVFHACMLSRIMACC